MKKKLILHIGTEKTGTTTIQEFLKKNREYLSKQGIYIPRSIDFNQTGNCRNLATACMNSNRTDDHKRRENIIDPDVFKKWSDKVILDFRKEMSKIDKELVIISSEHFSSRLIMTEEVNRLYSVLSDIFDDIQVVIYLRRQDKYAISLYSTKLKEGGTDKIILPNKSLNERYDYYKICCLWEQSFKLLTVRIFHKNKLKDNNLISDFFRNVNIDVNNDKLCSVEDKNRSLSEGAQNFLINWNILYPKYIDGNIDSVHNEVVDYLESHYSGLPRLPLRKWVSQWMKKYEASNQSVSKRYFDLDGNIFDNDYEEYPEEYDSTKDRQLELVQISLDVQRHLFQKNKCRQPNESKKSRWIHWL